MDPTSRRLCWRHSRLWISHAGNRYQHISSNLKSSADVDFEISFWSLLPFGAGGRAHSTCEEASHAAYIQHHRPTVSVTSYRQVPARSECPQRSLACSIRAESTAVSYCQIDRSAVPTLLRYISLPTSKNYITTKPILYMHIYPRLTYSSSRNPQPLPLVPPLLWSALALHPGLPLCPRHLSSYLHRNSLLLWVVRVACPLRPLRLSLGWRERLAEHGFRVCDG